MDRTRSTQHYGLIAHGCIRMWTRGLGAVLVPSLSAIRFLSAERVWNLDTWRNFVSVWVEA